NRKWGGAVLSWLPQGWRFFSLSSIRKCFAPRTRWVYTNNNKLKRQLHDELISPLLGIKKKMDVREPRDHLTEPDPLRISPRNPPPQPAAWTDPLGPSPYGSADLDPFGGQSGGMIFDPFRGPRTQPRIDPLHGLPPGAVPPGARFDPFGPVGSGRFG
ncbi:hypothetical protein GDO86_018925, partial [Hymenochirus boettgeri]